MKAGDTVVTTGQNGLNQARVFGEVAGVTGIVLTKLDGTAKGGIVVAVQRQLGVPVKLGRNGVEQIIEIKLQKDEQAAFDKSAAAVRELVDKLKL